MPRRTADPKARPAGTPPSLAEQQADFTAEGSPPPGQVAAVGSITPALPPGARHADGTLLGQVSPAAPASPPAAPRRRSQPR